MSMPITAIWVLAVLGMGVLLLIQPLSSVNPLVGQEHGRTIPLPDVDWAEIEMNELRGLIPRNAINADIPRK
jgi:hypothetical protein